MDQRGGVTLSGVDDGVLGVAGVLPLDQVRAITDRSGISVGDELDRLGWAGTAAFGKPLRAYLELHIEQGPILEASGSSIGVVTGVQGIRWFRVTIEGFPAHAGTTPMDRRRDPSRSLAVALSGLHEMAAAHAPQVRLTPAMFASEPVSPNTVPDHITFTVDMRHPDAGTLESLDAELRSLVTAGPRPTAAGTGSRSSTTARPLCSTTSACEPSSRPRSNAASPTNPSAPARVTTPAT